MTPGDDLVTALAERLRDVPHIHSSECAILDDKPCDCITFPAYELLAREALAVVAEQLPTRETWGRVLYHLDCPDGDPVECPHWESELYAEEREDFMRKADALLRELRERLGQP